jgi:hypothetical protein
VEPSGDSAVGQRDFWMELAQAGGDGRERGPFETRGEVTEYGGQDHDAACLGVGMVCKLGADIRRFDRVVTRGRTAFIALNSVIKTSKADKGIKGTPCRPSFPPFSSARRRCEQHLSLSYGEFAE